MRERFETLLDRFVKHQLSFDEVVDVLVDTTMLGIIFGVVVGWVIGTIITYALGQ